MQIEIKTAQQTIAIGADVSVTIMAVYCDRVCFAVVAPSTDDISVGKPRLRVIEKHGVRIASCPVLQTIEIGPNIAIMVLGIRRQKASLGVFAPAERVICDSHIRNHQCSTNDRVLH